MNGNDSVNSPAPESSAKLRRACIILTLVTLLALPAFAGVGYLQNEENPVLGIQAACVAAAICWIGAIIALLCGGLMRGTENAVNGVLLGMLFRMGIPLGGGFALHQLHEGLAKAGVFGMILAYYFVTLFAETLLAVKLVGPTGNKKKAIEAS